MTEPTPDPDDLPARQRPRRGTELAIVSVDLPPPAPPEGAVLHPPPPADPERRWFPAQLLSEFRLATRMYFDPRYRISRTAQFMFPVLLGLFALNYFFFSVWIGAIPLVGYVGPVLDRLGCVLLGVVAYKVMTRELVRYRDVLDYLTRYGQR